MAFTSTLKPIRFFDIPDSRQNAWSPNTWKVRYALNIKRLPYETTWVEYPDIVTFCKEIGAKPTDPGETPEYTLPAIEDTNNDIIVSGSLDIVRYLDESYPSTPSLFGPTRILGLQLATSRALGSLLVKEILPPIIVSVHNSLSPRGQAYFRQTRERRFGRPLEEVCPPGQVEDAQWARLESLFAQVARWFNAQPGPFFTGDQVCYLDVQLASYLTWIRAFATQERWTAVMRWNDGLWEKLMEEFDKWGAVDVGSSYNGATTQT